MTSFHFSFVMACEKERSATYLGFVALREMTVISIRLLLAVACEDEKTGTNLGNATLPEKSKEMAMAAQAEWAPPSTLTEYHLMILQAPAHAKN